MNFLNKRPLLKKILAVVLVIALYSGLITACILTTPENSGNGECIDGCDIPESDGNGNQIYSIVSPVGYHNVEMIEQAKRLDSMSGKTFALVGGSFMASVTHPVIKGLIESEFPDSKVLMFSDVGSGGPYSVFGQSEQTKNFQNKLKELGVDAVISGNCGCGLCTTKESGSSIAAEYIGIPSVTVGAPTFIAEIHSTGVNRGVPVLRTAEYPGAFSSHSTKELEENTKNIVWKQIKKALTTEITDKEIALYASAGERPYDEIVYYGTYEEIQDYCLTNGWTDGLPVVPPTDAKVREYLKYTPHKAEEELGTYALAYRKCLTYTVAANAVMSGVPKEFMPVCVAFTKALADGEWRRPLASTHGWTPYAWLNGPVARQLGIDNEQGMISEENNKALGRFIDLVMLNIGGYYVKENRMGTFGYLTPFTFSENEQACLDIGWQPYHVTKGYELNDNTVTAASALSWGNNVTPATDDPEMIMTLLAFDITEKQQNGLGNTNPQVPRTVFITSEVANDLAKKYNSKEALEDALIETARRPLYMRAFANFWANTGSTQFDKYTFEQYYNKLKNDPAEKAALTDTPDWLKGVANDGKIMTVATMNKGETAFLITGDSVRNKFEVIPGGDSFTVKIDLPENWNKLVEPLGYEPIENFYLKGGKTETKKKSENKDNKPKKEKSIKIKAPNVLSDGNYRIVPSVEQLTEAGRIVLSQGQKLDYFKYGASEPQSLTLDKNSDDKYFLKMMSSLGFSCSFTVDGGVVTDIILRPSTVAKKPLTDCSGLNGQYLSEINLTISVNLKLNKEAGGITPTDTAITLSSDVKEFLIDLEGVLKADSKNGDFITVNNQKASVNSSAADNSTAKFGVQNSDGSFRTFTFTKTADKITVTYKNNDTLN